MRILQITMTGAAVPIVAKGVQPSNSLPFQTLVIQNNGANVVRVGDASVSATKGISVSPTGGSSVTTPWLILSPGLEYTSDAYEFFLFGTSGDKVDVLLLD